MKFKIIKYLFISAFLFPFITESKAQIIKYSVDLIADSLKEHADAVIRYQQTDIKINNKKSADYYYKEVITILTENGENFAYAKAPYDNKLRDFVSLSEKIYDKNGILQKTIKKKDIKDISLYSGFFSDNRLKYTEKPALSLPYTIEYEMKLHYNGFMSIETWMPVYSYNLAVEKAELNIISPENYSYRIKENNFFGNKYEETYNSTIHRNWQVSHIKPVSDEPFNYSLTELVPVIYAAPCDFTLEGFEGNMETWQNFGQWIEKLNNERDALPENTINEIKTLVKNISDKKLKAKAIYEYMQNKTRYVSIQLGIGGWQPFEASYTDRNGYGDCKALSYYTQALLKTAGIKSYYAIVNAGNYAKPVITDFPSLQFNHVILCLPIEKDTIWLECTSQKIPFGYLSDFTDDRNVLLITENGGKLVHTTPYPKNINTQIRKANIKLTCDGQIKADIYTNYNGLQYDNVSYMQDLPDVDKIKKIKKRIALPALTLDSFSYENHKNSIPSADEYLKFTVKNYASTSSGRLFLKPNLLNQKKYIPKKLEKRKSHIDLRFAYTDIDTLIYSLPENLSPEYIPDSVALKSEFGTFFSKTKLENNKLIYIRKIIMNKGTFPAKKYSDLRKFYKSIVKSDKQTCVFKITEN